MSKDFKKVGDVVIRGEMYTDREGKDKYRYHRVGVVFASPNKTRMSIKFEPTIYGEGKFANIYWDDDRKNNKQASLNSEQGNNNENKQASKQDEFEDYDNKPIDLSEIPF